LNCSPRGKEALQRQDLVSVGEKDKRIDAVMLPDSIGVVRSLALGFNGITAGSFGLYNGDGTLESENSFDDRSVRQVLSAHWGKW
jgi:hypothetical protein